MSELENELADLRADNDNLRTKLADAIKNPGWVVKALENTKAELRILRSSEEDAQQFAHKCKVENGRLREALEKIGAIGTVYTYPDNWNSAKEGGSPEINDFDQLDLSALVEETLQD
jgi:predicted nuclease with TOPRIM domain